MNENLKRLKALVAETNEVVANLNKETEDIRNENQEERAKKYEEIKAYLKECVEITRELDACLKVRVDIPGYHYLGYSTEIFLYIRDDKDTPLKFVTEYVRKGGDRCTREDRAFRDISLMSEVIDLPYDLSQHNSYNFIDNWNQEVFEKRFAAEVERAITEKAEAANKKYKQAVDSQEILRR